MCLSSHLCTIIDIVRWKENFGYFYLTTNRKRGMAKRGTERTEEMYPSLMKRRNNIENRAADNGQQTKRGSETLANVLGSFEMPLYIETCYKHTNIHADGDRLKKETRHSAQKLVWVEWISKKVKPQE